MRFEWPFLLWLAPAVAVGVALLAWWALNRRIARSRAWSAELGTLARRGRASSVPLLGAAALAAAVAAAGPRGGRMESATTGRGLNVLIAVDVSRSMLAEDAEPNRLQHAIREARRLVQDLPSDRIGVVAFAGQSYVLTPLTLDHAAVNLYLETLDPDLASAGGTNLEAVLRQASQLLEASLEGGDRAMVLFTDGEGHDSAGLAAAAARDLAREGNRLIVVGQGGVTPVRIPIRDGAGALIEYKRDADGAIVETARRDDLLQSVASAAGGLLVPATLPDQAGAVRDDLGALSRRPMRERRLADLAPLAWIAALLAAGLLLLHTATRRTASLALIGLALLAHPVGAQRVPPGERLLRRGQAREAVTAFRAEAGRTGADTAWFNAGTVALEAGQLDQARDALERASSSLDPGLRYRALYNLGLAAMRSAAADTSADARAAREAEALARFKQALLISPAAGEAKWNMELLLRNQPPSSGRRAPSPPQPREGNDQQPRPAGGGLSQSEAEAILSSVEQNESMTRSGVVRRQRLRTAASRKDW
ncbi:MAG: von Willebrand factor type [Gemmatimonadetes bacterium]|nr:von Willebrand factor type [Gemmatimonadota bacterium]